MAGLFQQVCLCTDQCHCNFNCECCDVVDCTGCNWEYPDSNYTFRAKIVQRHKDYQQAYLWTLANDDIIPQAVRSALSAYGLCKDEFTSNKNWPEQLYIRQVDSATPPFNLGSNCRPDAPWALSLLMCSVLCIQRSSTDDRGRCLHTK